jgi:3,4-dihydroxy-2-butanone 4-phosphate synthase
MAEGALSSIESAIEAIRGGSLVLCVDDFDRENEGDFIGAAQCATAAQLALVVRLSTGIVCAPLSATSAAALELPLMVPHNTDPFRTAFTVSVDYRHGTTTGVSARDRCATLLALARACCGDGGGGGGDVAPSDFARPGHVFPLVARPGGVLVRGGHTEASLDLVRLAGAGHAAYLCEVVSEEGCGEGDGGGKGDMARLPELRRLAARLRLPLVSIADLQRYRYRREITVAVCGGAGAAGAGAAAGGTSGESAASAVFESLVYAGVRYAAALAVRGDGSGAALLVTFAAHGAPPPHEALAAAAAAAGAASLLSVHVEGEAFENVEGKDGALLAAGGAGGGATAPAPASAYDGLLPPPPGASGAAPACCDRAAAEVAAVAAACARAAAAGLPLRGAAPAAALPAAAWAAAGRGSGGGPLEAARAAAVPVPPEAHLVKTAAAGWPLFHTLLRAPGQPLPRVWEWGVNVSRVADAQLLV